MTGAGSRRKGASFERELVPLFRKVMPGAEVKRGLQQSRSGQECADVEAPAFWIEAKRHKRVNVHEAVRQAVACCPPGKWPLVVAKNDHEPAIVVMKLDDFLDLLSEWWEGRQ